MSFSVFLIVSLFLHLKITFIRSNHVPEDLKYTQSTGSSINTKFRNSKRTIGVDGADVVLGPDTRVKPLKDEQYRI